MPGLRGKGVFLFLLLWSASCVFLFCEYLIYFPAVWRCSWPEPGDGSGGSGGQAAPVLRALVLSDTHLLGALRGHWFDKLRSVKSFKTAVLGIDLSNWKNGNAFQIRGWLRAINHLLGREWQMERAFQTALWLLQPEVVFILGDIFDEGKWSSPEDWEDDVRRFLQMFRHPSDTELVVVVGNHDIGFHYEMSWFKLQRFEKVFNATSARIVTRKGVNFLLVNSVALHGDGCSICQSVEKELFRLSHALNCSTQASFMGERCRDVRKLPSSRPIILQHYPLYRASDAGCAGEDAAPPEERNLLFKEQYDVLSQAASQKLVWWFRPRLILSGHTHSACEVLHEDRFPEISVPSFSWRNRNNPSFILGSFTSETFNLSKCFLPQESTVIAIYCACAVVLIVLTLAHFHLFKGTLHCASCLMSKHKSL